MRLREIIEGVGRVVKGVNTTIDVGPDEIKKQAAKFGNTVDKDGRPPLLNKRIASHTRGPKIAENKSNGTQYITAWPFEKGHSRNGTCCSINIH